MISQLAKNTKKEDNFGMRDKDWEVYKKISKVELFFWEQTLMTSQILQQKESTFFTQTILWSLKC